MRFLVPAAAVVVLDQITKQLFWRNGRSYEIIDGFFNITLIKNSGAAFGLFQGGRVFFVLASVAAVIFLLYLGMRLPPAHSRRRLLLALILGGAVGNLIDRVYAGEVIDFLQIGFNGHYWPVFNVADMAVSLGAVFLVLHLLRGREPEAAPRTLSERTESPDG